MEPCGNVAHTARAKEKEQHRDRQQWQGLLEGACPAGDRGSSIHAKDLEAHRAEWAGSTGDQDGPNLNGMLSGM